MPPLILASGSPYRSELLARLGLAFEIEIPSVDEKLASEEATSAAVLRLARLKAAAVAARRPDALVLAGDQLAELDGRALGKPRNPAAARDMLSTMSGRTVTYCTALALIRPGSTDYATRLDRSRVTLRELEPDEIGRYLESENVLDCAGALKLEGLGIGLCERIETQDPTALIGLPLIATAELLRRSGCNIP